MQFLASPSQQFVIRIPTNRVKAVLARLQTVQTAWLRLWNGLIGQTWVAHVNEWDQAVFHAWAPRLRQAQLASALWSAKFQRALKLVPRSLMRPSIWRTAYLLLVCISLFSILNLVGQPTDLHASSIVSGP